MSQRLCISNELPGAADAAGVCREAVEHLELEQP